MDASVALWIGQDETQHLRDEFALREVQEFGLINGRKVFRAKAKGCKSTTKRHCY